MSCLLGISLDFLRRAILASDRQSSLLRESRPSVGDSGGVIESEQGLCAIVWGRAQQVRVEVVGPAAQGLLFWIWVWFLKAQVWKCREKLQCERGLAERAG